MRQLIGQLMDHWDWYLCCLRGTQQELEVMRMPSDLPLVMRANNMTRRALLPSLRGVRAYYPTNAWFDGNARNSIPQNFAS